MLKRPYIPVRDGLRFPKSIRPRFLPVAGFNEYRAGFWLGYIAGGCWGAVLATVLWKVVL